MADPKWCLIAIGVIIIVIAAVLIILFLAAASKLEFLLFALQTML